MSNKVKTGSADKRRQNLWDKAKTLPNKSGCYLLKRVRGDREEILYVGKAKALKSRVASYFNNSAKSPKTEILVGHVTDFDFIITDNEAEAFVLENNLIKKYSPKYNIRLKDDKSYPYVIIDYGEVFPRPVYTRRPKRSRKSKVYGPFTTGSNISQVLRVLVKSFQLRDCSVSELKRRKRPCLLHQMKQCTAPCVDLISSEDYEKNLARVQSFFEGKADKVLKTLALRMMTAADNEEFELAAQIRDNIQILSDFIEQSFNQNVELGSSRDVDVVAYHVNDYEIDISVYIMRAGLLLGHKNYHFQKGDNKHDNVEIFQSFLYQYYTSAKESLPSELVLGLSPENMQLLSDAFDEVFAGKLKLKKPVGPLRKLYELTCEHAKEHQRFRSINQESVWVGMNKLKELLNLKEAPRLLECYDIAIWQGKSPTAAQIVFHEGKPDKTRYRYYHLEERDEGNNDFAMMKEVLARRLKKGQLPDVFIVDGGKGQVSAFCEVLKEFNLTEIPVVGIAKERSGRGQSFKDIDIKSSDERLIIPNRINPYILKKTPSLFKVLVQMRDEAHRFSRKLHHKQERRRIFDSWFSDIEGIGPKRQQQLLSKLDVSFNELAEFSIDKLMNYFEISEKLAYKIYEKLSQESTDK